MQCKVSMDLQFCLSEKQFSLDILVMKLAMLFEERCYSQILRLVLMLLQEVLVMRLLKGKGEACGCGGGHWTLNGDFMRRIRTRLGAVELPFRRVRCSSCGRAFSPIQRLLKLGRYQTKTNELEKLVVETVGETSYRRGVAQLRRDCGLELPHRTAHGWVLRTDCDEITPPAERLAHPVQLLPDGTGFKGEGEGGQARRGDLKALVCVTQGGELVPVGSWAGLSWQEIHVRLKEKGVSFAPGSIVVCDGELGLAEGFAQYVEEVQRCHWHLNRDLYHAMRLDGAGMKEARPARRKLAAALAVELPAGDFQKVSDEDKAALAARTDEAEGKVMRLVAELEARGYEKAASYLRRAKAGLFGYVRRWLKWGLVSPKASSMIERVMRELARRIKNIAYGWSDRGVAKIARIILRRFADEKEWEDYWKKRFGDDLSVVVLLKNLKGSLPKGEQFSQDLAH